MKYPFHFIKLIDLLKKLPGVGTKSAERFAFELLNWPEENLQKMAEVISTITSLLKYCKDCGSLIDIDQCPFCDLSKRNPQAMCIVSMPRDVFAIEATHEYQGLYHVLGALLSPLAGVGPEKLSLEKLKNRMIQHGVIEAVIAIDSTLEGDATALFLKQQLEPLNVRISRLAFGLPMGSSLDYVDGGTLARALIGRSHF